MRMIGRMLQDRKAATSVEYGLILALIVLALMVGLTGMGGGTQELWGSLNTKVTKASNIK
jgi:pilus assembly protein Flp/PilA